MKNAEIVEPPTYLCKGDGKWTLPTGACKCKAGFEPDFDKQTCNGKNIMIKNFFSLVFCYHHLVFDKYLTLYFNRFLSKIFFHSITNN